MTTTDRTRKQLWGRSGNICSLCGAALTEPASEMDPAVIVGEECHVISKSSDGPRYDPYFTGDHDGYDNLILLCPTHHRIVDTQVGVYSVDRLKLLKAQHEAAIAHSIDVRPGMTVHAAGDGPFDNYRTLAHLAPFQSIEVLEGFQQNLREHRRVRAYGKVTTGWGATADIRTHVYVQAFLPIPTRLVEQLARDAGVVLLGVSHERLAGIYRGEIPRQT